MHYFWIVNLAFVFLSSFVAYGCHRKGWRGMMWLNIVAVAINVVAVVLGLYGFINWLTADEDAYDYNKGVVQQENKRS